MGGFFGATLKNDAVLDVFFGVDYHSHLGTKRAGMAAYNESVGMQREIHNIENSPFRTKFEGITEEMSGNSAIGCISDSDPQPILIRSKFGVFAIAIVGVINNSLELTEELLNKKGGHFNSMTGGKINSTELIASLISERDTIVDGIKYAQSRIVGSASILILLDDGSLVAARDAFGRIPVLIGKREDGFCVSFESFAFQKLEFSLYKELGPSEIVSITSDSVKILSEAKNEMKICSFLWSYYGYPTSTYEGVNVEVMRNKNGAIMAKEDNNINISTNISTEDLQVYFIDVGQADSILIINKNESMLIDAGNNDDGNIVVDFIKNKGINKLNYVIGTHPHEDHIGGLDDVINNLEVENVLLPNITTTTKTFEDVISAIENKKLSITCPKIGDTFKIGEGNCEVMSSIIDKENLNLASLVIRLEYGKNSFLFTGDAETENEKKRNWEDVDVLKVGHHGSTTSSSATFLTQIKPEIAVICVGKGNDYGHPHDKIVNRLKNIGAKIYRTDKNGTILITSDGNKLNISTSK